MIRKVLILSSLFVWPLVAQAQLRVSEVNLVSTALPWMRLEIKKSGRGISPPLVNLAQDHIQVTLEGAVVWPKITKTKEFGDQKVNLMAYQFTKDTVRIRAYLGKNWQKAESESGPGKNLWEIEEEENLITLRVKNPYFQAKNLAARGEKGAQKQKVAPKAAQFDEKYLQRLLTESTVKQGASKQGQTDSPGDKFFKDSEKRSERSFSKKNESAWGASDEKSGTEKSSLNTYLIKYMAFMVLVLLSLFGLFMLMKKGAFKKGPMGWMNNQKNVNILNQTYIGPKRSLMTVKVGKQLFLLANSETGIQFLSEIKDTASFLKEGEEAILGHNFDTKLSENLEKNQDHIKLKPDLVDSLTRSSDLEEVVPNRSVGVKERTSFSKELASKIKNLRALQ